MQSHIKKIIDELGNLTTKKAFHDEKLSEINEEIEILENKLIDQLKPGSYATGTYCATVVEKTVKSPKSTSWKTVAETVFKEIGIIGGALLAKFPESEKALTSYENKLTKAYNASYEVSTKESKEVVKTSVSVAAISK
jgi:hypothetical protein